jgi:Domain of unknown function (DUF4440)
MLGAARYFAAAILFSLPLSAFPVEPTEISLRAADAEQMRIIVEGDAQAQQVFMHPNYIINGPANKVLRKPILVQMLAQGKMASDRFERVIEGLAITGNVGIVMGREVVHPLPNSELGALHGDKVLHRRFTNIFLFQDSKWLFLARQATIVN